MFISIIALDIVKGFGYNEYATKRPLQTADPNFGLEIEHYSPRETIYSVTVATSNIINVQFTFFRHSLNIFENKLFAIRISFCILFIV